MAEDRAAERAILSGIAIFSSPFSDLNCSIIISRVSTAPFPDKMISEGTPVNDHALIAKVADIEPPLFKIIHHLQANLVIPGFQFK